MRVYEIDSGHLKDCKIRGKTTVKVITKSDVIEMLDSIEEDTIALRRPTLLSNITYWKKQLR